jgi:hypothetical protein
VSIRVIRFIRDPISEEFFMKPISARLFLSFLVVLLFALFLTACGGREQVVPTPEPVATNTPAATDTPAPTATPEPTATSVPTNTPIPTTTPEATFGFVDFESPEAGVSLRYPGEWFTSDLSGFTVFASHQELLDAPEPGEEGAVALVIAGDATEFDSNDPVEILNASLEEFNLADDAEIVEGPTAVTINGQDAATAVIHGVTDNGTPLSAFVTAILNADRVVVFLAATPSETEAQFLPTFEAMANTIEVGEPTEPEVTRPAVEGTLLYGETATSAVTEAGPSAWGFIGLEGEVVDIIIRPLTDELDVVVDVLDESGASILDGEVDNSFGTEEIRDLTLPSSGTFIVLVRAFSDGVGDYELTVAEAGTLEEGQNPIQYGETMQGTLASEEETATWSFTGSVNDLVDITVTPLTDEFDVVVDVLDSSGASILPDGELDDSFDVEYIRVLRLPADDQYVISIRGFAGNTGDYEVSLALANSGLPGSFVFAADTLDAAEDEHFFPFTAVANEVITAQVNPEPEVDVVVSVYNDDTDELLDEVDLSTGFEELVFTVPADGNYYFAVKGFDGSTGAYEVTLLGSDAVIFELAFGDSVIGRLGESGYIDYLFSGVTGDTIVLTAETADALDLTLAIQDLDDNVLAEMDDNGSAAAETLTYTFTEDKLIIIRVEEFFGAQGEFTLSFDAG